MDDAAKTPEMENTQTRKTVKLNVPSTPVTAKLAGTFEETQTRKTVKIKPAASPSSGGTSSRPIQPVIATPLHSRDTDTGNLSVMSDTQTRRTVKLKPMAASAHHPVQVPPPAPVAPPAPAVPVSSGEDDSTRKVGMPKPAAKPGISLPGAAVKPEPVKRPTVALPTQEASAAPAAAEPSSGEDDSTRKVGMPKPAAKPGLASLSAKRATVVLPTPETAAPASPAPAAAPAAAEDDNTRPVAAVKPAAKPGIAALPPNGGAAPAPVSPSKQTMVLPADEEENPTVKISRPLRPSAMKPAPAAASTAAKPDAAAAPGSKPAAEAPSPVSQPAKPAAPEAKPAAPSLAPRPSTAAPGLKPLTPAQPAAPQPGAAAPKPSGLPQLKKKDASADAAPEDAAPKKLGLKKKSADGDAPAGGPPILDQVQKSDEAKEARPSVFYTVVAGIAAVLLLAAAGLSAVSYLNIYEGKAIQLPGVSAIK